MKTRSNPHCPICADTHVQSRGRTLNNLNQYYCHNQHWFSVDHHAKPKLAWIEHIDGVPTRKLADERTQSITSVFRQIRDEIKQLPDSNHVTQDYCTRFSGILIVDAKYVKVRGYPKKIAFIYAVDYLTHDIVCSLLAPTENYQVYYWFFSILKRAKYPLRIAVADDNGAAKPALMRVYPKVKMQLCQNHYIENIRRVLCVRTETEHQVFFYKLKEMVFDQHVNFARLRGVLHYLMKRFALTDIKRNQILHDIYDRREELFAYTAVPRCPKNTNLIELYNSHLNGRLKTIKGFKSFQSAKLWLNAYVLRRRTKSFTDCRGKFRGLNGRCSFEMTINTHAEWPDILGIPDERELHRVIHKPLKIAARPVAVRSDASPSQKSAEPALG